MNYLFECPVHGKRLFSYSMLEVKDKMPCPDCGEEMQRVYAPTYDIWKTYGSYKKGHVENEG